MFERKFTLRHVIKKFPELKEEYSPIEERFGVPWKMCFKHEANSFSLYLHCIKGKVEARPWSVDVDFFLRVISVAKKEQLSKMASIEFKDSSASWGWKDYCTWDEMIKNYMIDDTVTVECEVTIKKMTGISPKREIDFREPKEHLTDVVLKIGEEKFNVLKAFLATLSPYFNKMFFGDSTESKQLEVLLNDVDPESFQSFLEVVHGKSSITTENVESVLKLADRFDVNMVTDRCEEFLLYCSYIDDQNKFRIAEISKLSMVQKKCLKNVKTVEDVRALFKTDVSSFSHATLFDLLKLAVAPP